MEVHVGYHHKETALTCGRQVVTYPSWVEQLHFQQVMALSGAMGNRGGRENLLSHVTGFSADFVLQKHL